MSKIAQTLLDEIVQPPAKHTINESEPRRFSNYKYVTRTPSGQDNKTTRTIVVEKKRVINKLVPNDFSASRTKFKSRETLLNKAFVDTAVNTTVTGPLRCDNTCITNVRKRDNTHNCRCGQRRLNPKSSAKLVQTYTGNSNSFRDRACAHCIETANCGTQFLEKQSCDRLKSHTNSGTGRRRSQRDITQSISFKDMPEEINDRTHSRSSSLRNQGNHLSSNNSNLLYMGARRWALSQYPTRGPDF